MRNKIPKFIIGIIYGATLYSIFMLFDNIILQEQFIKEGVIIDKIYNPPYDRILVIETDNIYYNVNSYSNGFYRFEVGDTAKFYLTRSKFTKNIINCKL